MFFLKKNQDFNSIIYKEFLFLLVTSFICIWLSQQQSPKKVYAVWTGPEKPPYTAFSILKIPTFGGHPTSIKHPYKHLKKV